MSWDRLTEEANELERELKRRLHAYNDQFSERLREDNEIERLHRKLSDVLDDISKISKDPSQKYLLGKYSDFLKDSIRDYEKLKNSSRYIRDPLEIPGLPNPFSIGRQDLDPLAGFRPNEPGGGMIMGPDHPMFSDIPYGGTNQGNPGKYYLF
jgi:hypothetical protein